MDFDLSMAIPSISIDYAVMERSKKIKVVASQFAWSDLGSFESVYDYLAAHGQAANADYQSRKKIAQNLGIKNYKGTAEQNLQMLEMLKKQQDLSSLLKEQAAPQSTNRRATLPTATDPSWNTPMPSPASGMRYIPQPFGAPGNIAPATNNDDSWGKVPVKKSKRSFHFCWCCKLWRWLG